MFSHQLQILYIIKFYLTATLLFQAVARASYSYLKRQLVTNIYDIYAKCVKEAGVGLPEIMCLKYCDRNFYLKCESNLRLHHLV